MQYEQAALAQKELSPLTIKRRRQRGVFSRLDIWRSGTAEGGKIRRHFAPDQRKPSRAVITGVITASWSYSDNIVAQQPLFKLRRIVRFCRHQRAKRTSWKKRDAAIFRLI